jgi:toxin ParE1/3/4
LKRLRLHRLALKEFFEAGDFYKADSESAAEAFSLVMEDSFRLLAEDPLIGTPRKDGLRSFTVRQFPYNLIYRDEPDRVYILAIAHHRRKPGYWAKRAE